MYILRNNNAEKLLTNRQKNNCYINNQVTYPFSFQMNLFIFQISYDFCKFF